MSRSDKIAILISLVAVFLSYWLAERYFERLAHLEDEMAYVWQARVLARGQVTVSSPEYPNSFLWPFIVDYEGQRFGKYPLGWPLVLSLGERFGLREWVNPLLAGLSVWLTYLLGRRTLGEQVGLLAAGLTSVSPFFLVNSASLLSHPLGLVLSAGFALAWLGAFSTPHARRTWWSTLFAALALGALILTRPMTALAVAIPFALHGLFLLVKGDRMTRFRLLSLAGVVILISSLHFVWQYAVTGDPFLNPYTLWWEYDRVGFGPGHGRNPLGHTLRQAWINTRFSLEVGNWDLFGWPMLGWIFIPLGLFAALRKPGKRVEVLLLTSVFPSLVIIYLAYWVGASLYGPRYFFEGLYSLTLLSGAGIAFLAGWPVEPHPVWANVDQEDKPVWQRLRPLAVSTVVFFLVGFNLVFYLPVRMDIMKGLYGVERAHQVRFLAAAERINTPALIIVHPKRAWIEYGTLLELQSPFLDSPFVFVYSRGASQDRAVAKNFPERSIYHYYPDEPDRFYIKPRN